jgi:hypothetical protein
MEILGLDPYQSETQYLEGFFRGIAEWKQSGNVGCRFQNPYLERGHQLQCPENRTNQA